MITELCSKSPEELGGRHALDYGGVWRWRHDSVRVRIKVAQKQVWTIGLESSRQDNNGGGQIIAGRRRTRPRAGIHWIGVVRVVHTQISGEDNQVAPRRVQSEPAELARHRHVAVT